jgi:hypothetical protein
MVEQKFEPVIVYAVVIMNKKYGLAGKKDLPQVEGDLVRVREALAILRIPKSNITVV